MLTHGEHCPRKAECFGVWFENENTEDDESEEEILTSDRARKHVKWTLEKDIEFAKRVRLHREGNWKEIMENSPILQERYKTAPTGM